MQALADHGHQRTKEGNLLLWRNWGLGGAVLNESSPEESKSSGCH